jgi:hypothetical protein
MSRERAVMHFLGKAGHTKLNCGQTIINAFKEKFFLSDELISAFEKYGGGRAPEGHCGSFYAAKIILEKQYPDVLKECENLFLQHAGSTKCKQIRASRKLSCLGCVEKAAECIEKV